MLITPITNSFRRVIGHLPQGVGHETLRSWPRACKSIWFFFLPVTSLTSSSALKRRLVSGVTQLRQARRENRTHNIRFRRRAALYLIELLHHWVQFF